MQLSFFDVGDNKEKKSHRHNQNLAYSKRHTIQKNLAEWNTIADVELYEMLYQVYTELFNLTYQNKLDCLEYFIDEETDGNNYTVMYAEIKDTWDLELKERYNLHLDLLNRIKSGDNTLIYADKTIHSDNTLSLFNSI